MRSCRVIDCPILLRIGHVLSQALGGGAYASVGFFGSHQALYRCHNRYGAGGLSCSPYVQVVGLTQIMGKGMQLPRHAFSSNIARRDGRVVSLAVTHVTES